MNHYLTTLIFMLVFFPTKAVSDDAIPHLTYKRDVTQLVVDGKPFLMIAGELHNSSASTVKYMNQYFPRLKSMNLNSVLAAIAWEQFEPEEGSYDYTLVDNLIELSRKNDLKLVILWFATWKNGQSSYAPMWVKRDTQRFWRVQTSEGENIETLSPFCEETKLADARAFSELMKRIKSIDNDSTVIMVQPENEIGILQDMDYRNEAIETFYSDVPQILTDYLVSHKDLLKPYIREAWNSKGNLQQGTWPQIFGDTPASREIFMAWHMARFVDFVVKSGKREHPLPMFVNAWIVQSPGDLPGIHPNGGPVSRVMDIYKAASSDIFTLCPDIYLPNFKEICLKFSRDDNPLLIPESTVDAGRAFYVFAEHDAMCYSPFGIEERAKHDFAFQGAYSVLRELESIILKYQGTGKMYGILRERDEESRNIHLGDYSIDIFCESKDEPCYGLIIQTDNHEFLVAGVNLRLEFNAIDNQKIGYIGQVWEGGFENEKWNPTRLLNGDETYHNASLRVFGRNSKIGSVISPDEAIGPQPVPGQQNYFSQDHKQIRTPGIYKVLTYLRD